MNENITWKECERLFEESGITVILNDGKVVGFENTKEQHPLHDWEVIRMLTMKYLDISAFIITQWKEICK